MTAITLLALGVLVAGRSAAPAGSAASIPRAIVIATARGESVVPVYADEGHPALPTPLLIPLLPMTQRIEHGWAVVGFAGQPFRFLLGAPVLEYAGNVVPLAGGAYVARDTLFVPLQWLAEHIPRLFREGYRYDPLAARFEEARLAPVVTRRATPSATRTSTVRPPSELARRNGFRMRHAVVVDAGHGGPDDGNPGRYLPRGVKEKHVTLAVAKLLQDELKRRGVSVVMTRTTDTLIDLRDRARLCSEECDLFVSIHVNSLLPRRGYQNVNGFETYFLGQSATAEARRVAAMENEAMRYETGYDPGEIDDPVDFIFRDLQVNEFLRESALLADLVQTHGAAVHPGGDRGAAQNPYFVVLREATRPAILVETGFATNRRDGQFVASSSGQQKLAKAISDGIVEYLLRYEAKVLLEARP